jgi:hypothetical protein
MDIMALVVAAFLQLASLSLDQLRETIEALASALAKEYADETK